jgi:BASS family bile acid:Na+ symporter
LVVLSLLTNFVLVPLFVYLLLQVIPVNEPVKDGFIIMALASGPPALPNPDFSQKKKKRGSKTAKMYM